jgi:hypothetical protein
MLEGMAQHDSGEADTSAKGSADDANAGGEGARHRVRLPRFIVHEPVGAGTVVKRLTNAAGVKPCAGCERRAARLDRWLRIEPRR